MRILSDRLEILLGEWLAYAAIDHYYRHTHNEFHPEFKIREITQKVLFENVPFQAEHDGMLTNTAYLFDQVGITFTGSNGNCKYEEIKITIGRNIHGLKGSFIGYFDAGFTDTYSERDGFSIHTKCTPLFDQFVEEGYCTQVERVYYWTPKIRLILEMIGYWESNKQPSKNEKLMATLTDELKEELNHYAETNQLIMAVKTLKDEKQLDLRTAKFFIEEFMFPEQFSKRKQPTFIKWYGP